MTMMMVKNKYENTHCLWQWRKCRDIQWLRVNEVHLDTGWEKGNSQKTKNIIFVTFNTTTATVTARIQNIPMTSAMSSRLKKRNIGRIHKMVMMMMMMKRSFTSYDMSYIQSVTPIFVLSQLVCLSLPEVRQARLIVPPLSSLATPPESNDNYHYLKSSRC